MAINDQWAQSPSSIKQLKSNKLKNIVKGIKTISGKKAEKIDFKPTTNYLKSYGVERIHEESSNPAVITFGRHQPIHQGHEKVFNKVKDVARKVNGKPYIFTSHSENEKNPLSASDKEKYIKKAAPYAEVGSSSKESPSILHIASRLHGAGHDELHMVVGSDRASDFEKTLNKYNGVKGAHGYYNFKKINVHSIGRDPDAEGVEGLSATKMRQAAKDNDHETFKSGLPDPIKKHSKDIFNKVRSGMGLSEALALYGITLDHLFEASALYVEVAGAGNIGTDELVRKYEKDTPGYGQMDPAHGRDPRIDEPFQYFIKLLMHPLNKGRPWHDIANDVKTRYPYVEPLSLYQLLNNITGRNDAEIRDKIYNTNEGANVWDKPNPVKNHKHLTPSQKARAKARAHAAGRPYPNMVDNIAVAKEEIVNEISNELIGKVNKKRTLENIPSKTSAGDITRNKALEKVRRRVAANKIKEEFDGCILDEDLEIHELIEEDFEISGTELYEDWGEPLEESEHKGKNVHLGKPFLTPGGPKKRAVYVKNEKGNVIKVNFGDPNMRIKKNNPARRRSFRARHHCENPGPRTKARYWSCKAW